MKSFLRKRIVSVLSLLLLGVCTFGVSASNVRGDLNDDRNVNVSDVTYLINRLLGGDTVWTQDINGDGRVNIADVTALISYLLTSEWPWPAPQLPSMPDNAVVYSVNGYQFAMIPVDGGTFMMGRNSEAEQAAPIHQVTLSDYSIGMNEVTMGLWKAVMGSYPPCFNTAIDSESSPVHYCSWDQAREFIAQLNALTGLSFHLPSEAQWEFAARGGNLGHGYLYSGSDDINEVAWYYDHGYYGYCYVVGLLKPNELGLYDMTGNVSEFCEDDLETYSSEPQVDPLYVSQFSYIAIKVIRGGHYSRTAMYCTVTTRSNSCQVHGAEVGSTGFRLAL